MRASGHSVRHRVFDSHAYLPRHLDGKVRDFLRTAEDGERGRSRARVGVGGSHVDFPAFVKAYAWVFYRGGGAGDHYDDDTGSGESSSSSSDPTRRRKPRRPSRDGTRRSSGRNKDQGDRKLGYGSTDSRGSRGRSWSRERPQGVVGGRGGIGEEAELRRWRKRLGEKQMQRLKRVFDEWAVDDAEGGRGATVEARDLERCFRELGKDGVQRHELRAWCDEVDLAPGDALSLADFAYAYHALFIDAGERGRCFGLVASILLCNGQVIRVILSNYTVLRVL